MKHISKLGIQRTKIDNNLRSSLKEIEEEIKVLDCFCIKINFFKPNSLKVDMTDLSDIFSFIKLGVSINISEEYETSKGSVE